jgi:polysaccharide export outer membrane protein
MLKMVRIVLVGLLSIALNGCFSSHPRNIAAFVKPDKTNVTADKYVLQPPDEIETHCARIPEINLQRQRIRSDGMVSFEMLGEVQAAGKTPEELAAAIKQKASKLYMLVGEEPIEVRIIGYKSKVFYVLGQVYQPGAKVYSGRDSVISALADAQPNPMAWLERVQVIRPSEDASVKPKVFEVNFDRMSAHGELYKDVLLQEGDIIYVPPTVLAAIAMKIEEVIRPIARAFAGVNIVQSGGNRQYVGGYGNNF